MKWYLKLFIIYCLQIALRMLYIIPIKSNRLLFSSVSGTAFNCNPKYIFEQMYNKYGDKYEYIWNIKDKALIPERFNIKHVRPLSIKHLYYLMTSKVIIANVGIEPFVPPRKGRIFINTWHGGGAYKKGDSSATYYSKAHQFYFNSIRDLRAKSTSFLISTNKRFSEIFEKSFCLSAEKILPIGMPRNDVFFTPEAYRKKIRQKVCQYLKINDESLIILYAPTYRGHETQCQHIDWTINSNAICSAVKERFGKEPILVYRCHENVLNDRQSIANSIDASEYPDMQELLVATDLLISDYSSLIWDYSLSFKPGFLFTPDLDQYSKVTKLHTPIEQWQFPYSLSTEELCEQILNYDETKAIDKIKAHHKLLGSYENGTAMNSIINIIIKELNKI